MNQQRFGVPYSHCGCPLPGDTIGQRLGHLVSQLLPKHTSTSFNPLLPPYNNPSAYQGTHPSDHNCVRVASRLHSNNHQGAETFTKTVYFQKMQERRSRDAKAVQRGKMDLDLYKRGEGHDPAFLMPVPLFVPVVPAGSDVSAQCMGWNGGNTSASACAVVSRS